MAGYPMARGYFTPFRDDLGAKFEFGNTAAWMKSAPTGWIDRARYFAF
jgi:hypothetical protein